MLARKEWNLVYIGSSGKIWKSAFAWVAGFKGRRVKEHVDLRLCYTESKAFGRGVFGVCVLVCLADVVPDFGLLSCGCG